MGPYLLLVRYIVRGTPVESASNFNYKFAKYASEVRFRRTSSDVKRYGPMLEFNLLHFCKMSEIARN